MGWAGEHHKEGIEVPRWAPAEDTQEKAIDADRDCDFGRRNLMQGSAPGNFISIKESGKEEKNIKRRIYDALNVMIAAGLLEKEDSAISIKKKSASSEFL